MLQTAKRWDAIYSQLLHRRPADQEPVVMDKKMEGAPIGFPPSFSYAIVLIQNISPRYFVNIRLELSDMIFAGLQYFLDSGAVIVFRNIV